MSTNCEHQKLHFTEVTLFGPYGCQDLIKVSHKYGPSTPPRPQKRQCNLLSIKILVKYGHNPTSGKLIFQNTAMSEWSWPLPRCISNGINLSAFFSERFVRYFVKISILILGLWQKLFLASPTFDRPNLISLPCVVQEDIGASSKKIPIWMIPKYNECFNDWAT